MTRFNHVQENFNSGEVGPKFYGRTTIDKYDNALKKCRNMIPLPQGPVTKRPGWRFINEVRTSNSTIRLLRFEFNVTQTYFLEFGPFYIRFYTNEAQVVVTTPVAQEGTGMSVGLLLSLTYSSDMFTGNTIPYEIVSPYSGADVFGISFQQLGDILFLFHNNYPPQ